MNAWLFVRYVSCWVQRGTVTISKVLNLRARVQESYETLD